MISMTEPLEIVIMMIGFLYWPFLYIRLRDILYGYKLSKKNIITAVIFAAAVTTALILLNVHLYSISGPYTFVQPLVATASVITLLVKTTTRRTKAKLLLLAAYLHIFWQIFPQINIIFIIADLAGIFVLYIMIKILPKITIPRLEMPKIRLPNIKLKRNQQKEEKPKKEEPKKDEKKEEKPKKEEPKKDEKKEERKEPKPISLKELWSN